MYTIIYDIDFEKETRKFPKADILKILEKIELLIADPIPANSVKIVGTKNAH